MMGSKALRALFATVLGTSAAIASQPNHPLDCGDWVFLEPGYSCSTWIAWGCTPNGTNRFCGDTGEPSVTDNQGRVIIVERVPKPESTPTCADYDRVQLRYYDGANYRVLAYVDDRCQNPNGNSSVDNVESPGK